MRFRKGELSRHPHWRTRGAGRPRPDRPKYTMTDDALRQRLGNLKHTRLRSRDESRLIKLFVWQSFFDPQPRPSQRALARELDVRRSYVFKVQRKAQTEGMDALLRHGRVTLDDLARAREFTARLREEGLLAPAPGLRLYVGEARGEQRRPMTADESIAEQRRFAEEWKREHPARYGGGRRVLFSVPVR